MLFISFRVIYIHAKGHSPLKERKEVSKMLNHKFGIEIEFTGITRRKAAEIVAKFFNTTVIEEGTYYDTKAVRQADGRKWKVM